MKKCCGDSPMADMEKESSRQVWVKECGKVDQNSPPGEVLQEWSLNYAYHVIQSLINSMIPWVHNIDLWPLNTNRTFRCYYFGKLNSCFYHCIFIWKDLAVNKITLLFYSKFVFLIFLGCCRINYLHTYIVENTSHMN